MTRGTLEVSDLTVVRGGITLVEEISFRAEAGKITVIIGPSGCGKTTVLKCAALLEHATRGGIALDGRAVEKLSERSILREGLRGRQLAYVFQSHALFDNLSVRANLLWPLEAHRLGGSDRRTWREEKARDAARRVGLPEELLERQVAALSGGERKRVAVARALVLDPRIVLYDEPTSGLDPIRARAIDRMILDLKGQNMTAVVASHDIESIRRIADEVLLLSKSSPRTPGRVVFKGSFEALATDPVGSAFIAGEEAKE